MSLRDPNQTLRNAILNFDTEKISILYLKEKQLIEEYKLLYIEEKEIEKNLNFLLNQSGLFIRLRIKSLQSELIKKRQRINNIENSLYFSNLIQSEMTKNRQKKLAEQRLYEEQQAAEAANILDKTPIYTHNDEYFDRLLIDNKEEFWREVKLEWRSKNPRKIETDRGMLFEKRCQYLSWMLSMKPDLTVTDMRKCLYTTNEENVSTMCIFDVIDRYEHYFSKIMI